MKPIVQIRNAKIITNYLGERLLRGIVLDHPNTYLNESRGYDGDGIVSSTIKHINNNRVETRNTVYNVLSWK